jgi:FtsP/CotA-like multicopper oxidase with cupredoxin domain
MVPSPTTSACWTTVLDMSSTALSRRTFLLAGAVTAAGLAGCSTAGSVPTGRAVGAEVIGAVEAARRRSGRTVRAVLAPRMSEVDLGGKVVTAMTYGGQLPGPLLRATAGDELVVDVRNGLSQETSVHWHGLALRNDADGVPDVTTPATPAGASSTVRFVVPDPGTYWLHPHTGLQLDWGLYAPLVVDDPAEPGGYDEELVVVLDDWTVGLGQTPEELLAALRDGSGNGGMSGMQHMGGGMGGMGDSGDVAYPAYLINGRLPNAAQTHPSKPGRRVRLRVINAAADTAFDLSLGGHALTVTHTDGWPVQPVTVGTIRLGMGERYDLLVTLGDGVFPLSAVPVGKTGTPARMLLRTGSGQAPSPDLPPAGSTSRRLQLADLLPRDADRLPPSRPDTTQDVVLAGDMSSYRWTINGRTYDHVQPLTVRQGQHTRLRLMNRSMMLHPVHLHGHTFAVRGTGVRKDTILVAPMQTVEIDVHADNPGRWMLHCHNAFHMESGMMTRLDYVS